MLSATWLRKQCIEQLLLAACALLIVLLLPLSVRAQTSRAQSLSAGVCRSGNCGDIDCKDYGEQIKKLEEEKRRLMGERYDKRQERDRALAAEKEAKEQLDAAGGGAAGAFNNAVTGLGTAKTDGLSTLIKSLDAVGAGSDSAPGGVTNAARKAVDKTPIENYAGAGSRFTSAYEDYERARRYAEDRRREYEELDKQVRDIEKRIADIRAACGGQGGTNPATAPSNAGSGSGRASTGGGGGGGGGSTESGSGPQPGGGTRPTTSGERINVIPYVDEDAPPPPTGTQPDAKKLARVPVSLNQLQSAAQAIETRIDKEAAPALAPFVDGSWEQMEPQRQRTLAESALPSVKALEGDYNRALSAGRQAVAAYAGVSEGTGTPAVRSSVPVLMDALRDPQETPKVRKLAKESLTQIGTRLGTGLQPSVGNDVSKPYRWVVVPTGAEPTATLAERRDGSLEAVPVPPGQYDLYWTQDYEHGEKPLLVAKDVTVGDQGITPVTLNSGLRLDVASWVPPRDKGYGWWGVTHTGEAADRPLHWTKGAESLLLPPGEYDLYWKQDYYHKPMLLSRGVGVEQGQRTEVRAHSGIQLKLPADTPALNQDYGWWGIVPAGGDPNKPVQWTRGKDQPLLVPPGTYDIFWKQDYSHQPESIKQAVSVPPNELIEVEARPTATHP